MEFKDKNGEEIFVGVSVDVPTPNEGQDLWNFEFTGTVIGLDKTNGYCLIEDGDGDCWCVEPERLEIE